MIRLTYLSVTPAAWAMSSNVDDSPDSIRRRQDQARAIARRTYGLASSADADAVPAGGAIFGRPLRLWTVSGMSTVMEAGALVMRLFPAGGVRACRG